MCVRLLHIAVLSAARVLTGFNFECKFAAKRCDSKSSDRLWPFTSLADYIGLTRPCNVFNCTCFRHPPRDGGGEADVSLKQSFVEPNGFGVHRTDEKFRFDVRPVEARDFSVWTSVQLRGEPRPSSARPSYLCVKFFSDLGPANVYTTRTRMTRIRRHFRPSLPHHGRVDPIDYGSVVVFNICRTNKTNTKSLRFER